MRSQPGDDQRVAPFPAAYEVNAFLQLLLTGKGADAAHQGMGDRAAQAQFTNCPGCLLGKEVVVHHRGGTTQQGFRSARQRADIHILRFEVFLHRPHDAVHPIRHCQGDAFLQAHRDVGMAVDQPRQRHHASRIVFFGLRICLAHLLLVTDSFNPLILDNNGSLWQDFPLFVHRHHCGVFDQPFFAHVCLLRGY